MNYAYMFIFYVYLFLFLLFFLAKLNNKVTLYSSFLLGYLLLLVRFVFYRTFLNSLLVLCKIHAYLVGCTSFD